MARKSISDERAPLLFKTPSRESSHKLVHVEMVRDEIEDNKRKVFKVEFSKILKMSGPVIFAYMLQNSLQTGSVLVVGRMVINYAPRLTK
jgi:MATE family multidrug resistance protein